MNRFEQGQEVTYNDGKKEYKGKVASAPAEGVWVEWKTEDMHWAHKNLFIPFNSSMYKAIKIDKS